MQFTTCINIPGYLPMDDDPPVFDTARDAWEYLADERKRAEEDFEGDGYSATVNQLEQRAQGNHDPEFGTIDEVTGVGTIYGATPGYEGDHDLGFAYSVYPAEEEIRRSPCCDANIGKALSDPDGPFICENCRREVPA